MVAIFWQQLKKWEHEPWLGWLGILGFYHLIFMRDIVANANVADVIDAFSKGIMAFFDSRAA